MFANFKESLRDAINSFLLWMLRCLNHNKNRCLAQLLYDHVVLYEPKVLYPLWKNLIENPIEVGDLYEDCGYRPRRCIEIDYQGDFLSGLSLIDNTIGDCSPSHCGPMKISQEEADILVKIWREQGERAVLIHKGWSEEDADKFMKEWR